MRFADAATSTQPSGGQILAPPSQSGGGQRRRPAAFQAGQRRLDHSQQLGVAATSRAVVKMQPDRPGRVQIQLAVHQGFHPATQAAVRQAQHAEGNPSATRLIPWSTKGGTTDTRAATTTPHRVLRGGLECPVGQTGSLPDNPFPEEVVAECTCRLAEPELAPSRRRV